MIRRHCDECDAVIGDAPPYRLVTPGPFASTETLDLCSARCLVIAADDIAMGEQWCSTAVQWRSAAGPEHAS